jgi:nuclear pore complex protein Nup205
MLALLRIINAAVIARGLSNKQTVQQALGFLKESRTNMVAVFKRSVNVGTAREGGEELSDLVDCFTVLVELTGFLQVSSYPLMLDVD